LYVYTFSSKINYDIARGVTTTHLEGSLRLIALAAETDLSGIDPFAIKGNISAFLFHYHLCLYRKSLAESRLFPAQNATEKYWLAVKIKLRFFATL
jgi:hypothetical protein